MNYIHKLKNYYHLLLFIAILLVPIDAGNTAEYQLVMKLPVKTQPDYTVGRDSKCSLHSLEMNRTEVDIVYGLRNESELREMGIDYNSFPNGRDYISGGCVVWSGMDVKAIIYLCSSCVEIRDKWLEKNSMEQIWVDRVKQMNLVDLR